MQVTVGALGHIVFYSKDDCKLYLYTINGKHLQTEEAGEKLEHMIASPSGEHLITGGEGKSVVIRSMHCLRIVKQFAVDSKISCLFMRCDTSSLFAALANGNLVHISPAT